MAPPRTCRAYGLLCELGFEWSWAPAVEAKEAPQLRIVLGELGRFAALPPSDYRAYAQRPARKDSAHPETPTVRIERGRDDHYRVSYADGAVFVIDRSASEIHGVSQSALTLDDLLVYLQGPIFGLTLRLRGTTCLHASAAVSNGRAFAVVGAAGMGKSTSAAAFARSGLPVLTDDVLALGDHGESFTAQSGLPRVMLWPESVAALWGHETALPRAVATWDKRYLDLAQPGYRFAREAAKLDAIYVLGDRLAAGSPVEFSDMSGTEAVVTLIANTYANDFLDAPLRARELDALGRIANHVRIRCVRAPDDRRAIPRICEAIVTDFDRMPGR